MSNFIVSGLLLGNYIIPFILFSNIFINNTQNSFINLIFGIIYFIICFIICINVQSYSYVLTNKHIIALSIFEKLFYIPHTNIKNITPLIFGISINHIENEKIETHKILFANNFIKNFLKIYKERK